MPERRRSRRACFRPDGRCLGIGRQEYQSRDARGRPGPAGPGGLLAGLRENRPGGDGPQRARGRSEVKALARFQPGRDHHHPGCAGRAIYPALVWLDNRAADQAAFLAERFGSDVYARTGIPEIVPTWSACKILWIRQNEPEVFSRAAKFLLVQDYLIYRLTGQDRHRRLRLLHHPELRPDEK